ncbi:MAG: glycosyltransferase family 4 protein [Chloroflexi bacterium]|nr:MAG: glycosyltransferase family 4 protein [Chloroflexota bacterium]
MRVLILKKGVSRIGGSESHARALARTLAARGHEVTLAGLQPAWRRAGLEEGTEFRDGDARVELMRTRLGPLGAAVDSLLPTSLLNERALHDRVTEVDIVHCIAREYTAAGERLARARKAAYVETPLVHPGQTLAGTSPADLARYRRADAVLALTEWERTWYATYGVDRDRVHVVGSGPVTERLPVGTPEPATILFVGRREPYKGYLALARAARLVWRHRPEARFVIIGQRGWHAVLTERAVPTRDPRWFDRGIANEETKLKAYASCTLFCMPSRYETFGLTYIEAWLARRPVIAGDIPALREVVGDGGLFVRQDPQAIADAILELLDNPARARQLGERGYERATTRYSWATVASRVELAYEAARSNALRAEAQPRR